MKIQSWDKLPSPVSVSDLIDRLHDRAISIADLNQLLFRWLESRNLEVHGRQRDCTKTSARSKFAVTDRSRRRFYFEGRQPREAPFKGVSFQCPRLAIVSKPLPYTYIRVCEP